MNKKEITYDVAFSFLKEDEAIVNDINQILKLRVKTFIFSEHQSELVGNDGEKMLNNIFHDDSRVVCVLFKKGWGETSWTRIEETAIKNRAYNDGYSFSIFVPLDKTPIPKWLPKTYIWYGMERYGMEGLASVIESKVQEQGGLVKHASPSEKILSYQIERKEEKERQNIIESDIGVSLAEKEISSLFSEIEAMTNDGKVKIQISKETNRLVLFLDGFSIDILWRKLYSNTTKDATLYITIYKGFPSMAGRYSFTNPKKVTQEEYRFGVNSNGNSCWVNASDNKKYLTKELLSSSINELLSAIKEEKRTD